LEELGDSEDDGEESRARFWENKCRQAEESLKERDDTETSVRNELEALRKATESKLEEHKKYLEISSPAKPQTFVDEAPPAVLKELNRVRIKLAETERRNRQCVHRNDDLQQQNRRLIREREEGRAALQRLRSLEGDLQEIRRQYDKTIAETQIWQEFCQSLDVLLKSRGLVSGSSGGPPEVSALLRFLDSAEMKTQMAEQSVEKLKDIINQQKADIFATEAKIHDFELKERRWNSKRKEWEDNIRTKQLEIDLIQGQNSIYKKEIESLRDLIKTFDGLPLSSLKSAPKFDTTSQSLELMLTSARDELDLMTKQLDSLKGELDASTKERARKENELDEVKEKFVKLREALQAERERGNIAEERAMEAERLAGKGSFNPELSRVLHIKDTPIVEALKEEVKVLRRQLEAAKIDRPSKLAPDPEKLNKRLKENFKEQISLFREGVYLMTGFKVDMLPGTDRPTFRVRSGRQLYVLIRFQCPLFSLCIDRFFFEVYSEQEEDHLMLKWPKGEEIASLDILNTDLARVLSTSPSYDYINKFQSLPAFLASVQLSLFEKQTVMM
jgi:hypothetical protein